MISQAINKTLELEANYICNAKFERLGYQWEAMYGTAVGSYDWKNSTNENNHENTTVVPELPDYDDYDDLDGSGSSTNITASSIPTITTPGNLSNNQNEIVNSTSNSDEDENYDENSDDRTVLVESTSNDTVTFL